MKRPVEFTSEASGTQHSIHINEDGHPTDLLSWREKNHISTSFIQVKPVARCHPSAPYWIYRTKHNRRPWASSRIGVDIAGMTLHRIRPYHAAKKISVPRWHRRSTYIRSRFCPTPPASSLPLVMAPPEKVSATTPTQGRRLGRRSVTR
jgi:hypothetical protein